MDAAAQQEFEAGALPALKEVVLRLPRGRSLFVAVDERRQEPLANLFSRFGAISFGPANATSRWEVLYADGHPRRARLEVAFRQPTRFRARVLFALPKSARVLRHAYEGANVCLVTRAAFAELEDTRRCGRGLIEVPCAPPDALEQALCGHEAG